MERRQVLTGRTVGFVPTMGALHRGHASLIERCRVENEVVVVSLFVNPSQFNDSADLLRYPQTPQEDLALLRELGVDEVFSPNVSELYPNGYKFRVECDAVNNVMEGLHRPGFLQGVMTVVLKLLNIIRANRAYFGEKDYQQLRVVTEMATDFFIPTEIIACPTIRETSGLAESSRNRLLSAEARKKAAALYRILTEADSAGRARALLEELGFAVEYVEEHWGRRFAAVFLGGVRLIDNVPCCETPSSSVAQGL